MPSQAQEMEISKHASVTSWHIYFGWLRISFSSLSETRKLLLSNKHRDCNKQIYFRQEYRKSLVWQTPVHQNISTTRTSGPYGPLVQAHAEGLGALWAPCQVGVILSFCLYAFLSFCLSVFFPCFNFCLFVFLSFCISVFLPSWLSAFLSFCLSAFLPFCLFFVFLSSFFFVFFLYFLYFLSFSLFVF